MALVLTSNISSLSLLNEVSIHFLWTFIFLYSALSKSLLLCHSPCDFLCRLQAPRLRVKVVMKPRGVKCFTTAKTPLPFAMKLPDCKVDTLMNKSRELLSQRVEEKMQRWSLVVC